MEPSQHSLLDTGKQRKPSPRWLLYPCGKNPWVSNEQEGGWAPELVQMF